MVYTIRVPMASDLQNSNKNLPDSKKKLNNLVLNSLALELIVNNLELF